MSTLFNDGFRSNDPKREQNIQTLLKNGFTQSGAKSTSGALEIQEQKTQTKLVFGKRSNIGGSGSNKYFSLSKVFKNKTEAMQYFNKIKKYLLAK